MAEIVEPNAVEWSAHAGRQPGYPWDEWLDGQVWCLVKGEDFSAGMASMRSLVSYTAGRRGLKYRSKMVGNSLYVQVLHSDDDS